MIRHDKGPRKKKHTLRKTRQGLHATQKTSVYRVEYPPICLIFMVWTFKKIKQCGLPQGCKFHGVAYWHIPGRSKIYEWGRGV